MKIIEVKKEEISVIKKLAYTIWPDTYKEILSVEQIEYMLNLFYNEEALLKQMKKQNFLLLEEKDQFIGFASYEINSKIKKTKLHKIYILPNLQGRGLGRFLLNEIIKRAQEANNLHLFLNVNKCNNALHFYKKIGFQVIADEVIPIGNNYVMNDFVLEKKID